MHRTFLRHKAAIVTLAMTTSLTPLVAQAQQQIEEVLVTARKRAETTLSTPVVVKAFTAQDLQRYDASSIESISNMTPSLVVGEGQTMVGGSISLRGVSTGTANSSSDQAVSVNMDGVQVARATLLRMGTFDLQQVEVLKGPQALFFGKNSPGGIISMVSADPGDQFEGSIRTGYGFSSREYFGEAVVSGPLSETLGARLVVHASDMQGPFKNGAFGQPGVIEDDKRSPDQTELFGRLTVTYKPSETFDFRLKGSYFSLDSNAGVEAYVQRVYCATGSAIGAGTIPGLDNCKADRWMYAGNPGPAYGGLASVFPSDGNNFMKNDVALTSMEGNFHLSDALTLTSITGFFHNDQQIFGNFSGTPLTVLVIGDRMKYKQFSQELRLTSDFEGPLNFLVGGHYDNSTHRETGAVAFFAPALIGGAEPNYKIGGESVSVFGQVIWNVTETVELSGGGRWSHEKKKIDAFLTGGPLLPTSPDQTFNNFSPEATLTWRPSDTLTVFGSYRQGFKSGGFNSGLSSLAGGDSVGATRPFAEEKVRGGEAGIKTALLDNTLRLDLAAYSFRYKDMQLTTFDPATGFSAFVTNAAAANIRGIELDMTWLPQAVEGLTLRGAVAYNRARYKELLATCYAGQTALQGCNVVVGAVTLQNMAGRRLVAAPDWGASSGFTYDVPLGGDMRLSFSSDAYYKSQSPTFLQDPPAGRQRGYWLLNASASLYDDGSGWDVSVIGKNLTNQFYVVSGFQDPASFVLPAGTEPNILGSVNRPREIMLQLTYRFGAGTR